MSEKGEVDRATHGAYVVALSEVKEVQRQLRVLRHRVEAAVRFPASGGRAVENADATALLGSLHDWLVMAISGPLWEETESPGGSFTRDDFGRLRYNGDDVAR